MREQFIASERSRILKRFKRAKHAPGFTDKYHLSAWYVNQLGKQDCGCYYCEISIFDIRKLIDAGLLATRRVKGEGVRGPVLEIDKKINAMGYTPTNCVLACYYCNNDKSYTVDADEYKRFYGSGRNIHFKHLIEQL